MISPKATSLMPENVQQKSSSPSKDQLPDLLLRLADLINNALDIPFLDESQELELYRAVMSFIYSLLSSFLRRSSNP